MTFGSLILVAAVRVSVLPCDKTGSAGSAKRSGHECVLEEHPFSGEPIDMRGLGKRMARDTKTVPSQFVRRDDDHVGPVVGHGGIAKEKDCQMGVGKE